MQNSESILSLRDILKIVFKRKGLIVIVTFVALFVSTVVTFLMPPTFESTAHILVRRSILETEEPQIGTDLRGAPTSYRQVAQADEMNTATSILKSRDLVIATMDKLALTQEQFYRVRDFRRYVRNTYLWFLETASFVWDETKYFIGLSRRPTPEEIILLNRVRFIDLVAKAVVVEQVPDSDVLRVGLRVSDPVLAKDFAEILSELALSWHSEKFRQSGNFSFFSEQAKKAGADLEKLEKELVVTRQELKIISLEEQRRLIIGNRYQFQANLDGIRARIAGFKAGIERINDMIKAEPQMTTLSRASEINPLGEQIAKKITELELSRIDSAGKHVQQSRILGDIDATLKGWNNNLKQVPPTRQNVVVEGINSINLALRQKRAEIEAQIATIEAEAKVIEKTISDHDREMEILNNGAYRVVDLERQVQTQAAVYEQYLKNAELARIAEAKQQARLANLNIIQSAPLPVRAIKPRKLIIILIAGASGILFGLAWGFATEMNDTTFDSDAEIRQALAIETLVTIPYHDPATFCRPSAMHEGVRSEIKTLLSRILKGHAALSQSQPIAFISSRSGEGTTTVMLQAAIAAASGLQRVLMVDAAQDTSLTRWFGCEEKKGLYDFQNGAFLEEMLQATGHPGLFLFPAGNKGKGRKLENTDWSEVMAVLKERIDIVFIDLGSLDKNPVCPQFHSEAGGVVFVIAAHTTRREIVQQAVVELHERQNSRILGAVLNRRRFFIPEFIYRIT
jgi:uncharacterized protein involved in exopolysaccharide biosynthesis/Mrp family chromosome partitioning ATPase